MAKPARKFPEWSGDADISDCGTWRYLLQRNWDVKRQALGLIMLNPSTATELRNDPTIRRGMGFAIDLGYGQLEVTNLFGYRATDPRELKDLAEWRAVGPKNDEAIVSSAKVCHTVICAWGNHGTLHGRDKKVLQLLRDNGIKPYALKLSKDGHPGHPLYLKADLRPVPMPA